MKQLDILNLLMVGYIINDYLLGIVFIYFSFFVDGVKI